MVNTNYQNLKTFTDQILKDPSFFTLFGDERCKELWKACALNGSEGSSTFELSGQLKLLATNYLKTKETKDNLETNQASLTTTAKKVKAVSLNIIKFTGLLMASIVVVPLNVIGIFVSGFGFDPHYILPFHAKKLIYSKDPLSTNLYNIIKTRFGINYQPSLDPINKKLQEEEILLTSTLESFLTNSTQFIVKVQEKVKDDEQEVKKIQKELKELIPSQLVIEKAILEQANQKSKGIGEKLDEIERCKKICILAEQWLKSFNLEK